MCGMVGQLGGSGGGWQLAALCQPPGAAGPGLPSLPCLPCHTCHTCHAHPRHPSSLYCHMKDVGMGGEDRWAMVGWWLPPPLWHSPLAPCRGHRAWGRQPPPPLPACLACHCTCQPLLQCLPWHQMDCTLSHRWWDQLGGAGVWGWWGWARVAAVLRGAACPCLPPSALPGLFAPPTLRACQPIMPAARDILRGVPGLGQLVQAALLPPPATRSPVPPAGPLPCLPCHPHLPSSAALGHVHHCYRLLPVNTGGGWWWGQLSGGGQGRHVPCRPPPATRPGAASRPPSPACPATLGCNAP